MQSGLGLTPGSYWYLHKNPAFIKVHLGPATVVKFYIFVMYL